MLAMLQLIPILANCHHQCEGSVFGLVPTAATDGCNVFTANAQFESRAAASAQYSYRRTDAARFSLGLDSSLRLALNGGLMEALRQASNQRHGWPC